MPTPMEQALWDLINQAASQIDIALHGLDRQSVISALINAHTRGAAVAGHRSGSDLQSSHRLSAIYCSGRLIRLSVYVLTRGVLRRDCCHHALT